MAYSLELASPLSLHSWLVAFGFIVVANHALKIHGNVDAAPDYKLTEQCSRTCKSENCGEIPILRYGKYCGLLYTGCPGEQPCDDLDACCMKHDSCIGKMGNDYLSPHCNEELFKCVKAFRKSGAPSFEGNTCDSDEIVKAIDNAMRVAILAKKVLGKP